MHVREAYNRRKPIKVSRHERVITNEGTLAQMFYTTRTLGKYKVRSKRILSKYTRFHMSQFWCKKKPRPFWAQINNRILYLTAAGKRFLHGETDSVVRDQILRGELYSLSGCREECYLNLDVLPFAHYCTTLSC